MCELLGIQGEAQALAPQSLAFYQDRTGATGRRGLVDPVRRSEAGHAHAAGRSRAIRACALPKPACAPPARSPTQRAPRCTEPRLEASATRERLSRNDIYPPPFGGNWVNQGRIALDFNYEFDFWGKHRAELEAAIGDARAASADAAQARLVLATRRRAGLLPGADGCAALAVARQTLARRRVPARAQSRAHEPRAGGGDCAPAVRIKQIAASRVEVSGPRRPSSSTGTSSPRCSAWGRMRRWRSSPRWQAYGDALALPANLPADLLARRPDIAAQRYRVESAAARIGAAKADFFPNLNLAAFAGFGAPACMG